jgi:hypothetical protein
VLSSCNNLILRRLKSEAGMSPTLKKLLRSSMNSKREYGGSYAKNLTNEELKGLVCQMRWQEMETNRL